MKLGRFFPILMIVLFLAACGGATEPSGGSSADPTVEIANPASVNCTDQGGTTSIESRPDGGQFGVCYFEDNMQCEEWAMLRGDCPVGGIRVTGYITQAGRYCAITGGTYDVTISGDADTEQGNCTLPDGSVCDAQAYYEGTCGLAREE